MRRVFSALWSTGRRSLAGLLRFYRIVRQQKPCPSCGHYIARSALKCRYCARWLA
jgi:hypothetical protein